MGIALTTAGVAAPDAAAYFTRTSQHHDGVQGVTISLSLVTPWNQLHCGRK